MSGTVQEFKNGGKLKEQKSTRLPARYRLMTTQQADHTKWAKTQCGLQRDKLLCPLEIHNEVDVGQIVRRPN